MQFRRGVFGGAVLVFGAALAVTGRATADQQPADPTAEQVFKNIQSFKGRKAGDVIPAMEFMSASLKVNCDYCHTADRASDEKPEKGAARHMISMQNDINEKNFRGRLQVTCATCHAGHIHPVSLPPVEGIDVRPQRDQNLTPEQVLAVYAKAMAGTEGRISGLRLIGQSSAHGEISPVEEIHSGDKFLVVTHSAKADGKVGFNGSDAWFQGPKGPVTIPRQYSTAFIHQQSLPLGAASLPKVGRPQAGTAKLNGRDMLVLSGTVEGTSDRVSEYFDKETGLLTRIAYSYPTILGSIPQINDFRDYRKVDGVPVPMTITRHSTEEDTVAKFRTVQANPKIDAKIFDPAK